MARELADPAAVPRADLAARLTTGLLLVIAATAWAHVLLAPMPDDMAGMGMAMAPTVVDGVAYVGAWAVMMVAMMLPSALPMIRLYAGTLRTAPSPWDRAVRIGLFTLVYLAFWAASGIPIYFASVALGALGPRALALGTAAVLVVAGLFQLSPLKRVCLRRCRSPLAFLLGHWRGGWRGSLALGGAHALYCVGCCWALMIVLVVAGAMGLPWVLLIAAVVAAEKVLPRGEWIARAIGVMLVVLGLAVAVHPDIAILLRGGASAM
jgi:predicted metal-binding membrane protein